MVYLVEAPAMFKVIVLVEFSSNCIRLRQEELLSTYPASLYEVDEVATTPARLTLLIPSSYEPDNPAELVCGEQEAALGAEKLIELIESPGEFIKPLRWLNKLARTLSF